MTWELVSLILGIILILVAAAIKIFKKDNNLSVKLPSKFYDIEKKVIELEVEFKNVSENIKELNKKIDKLTELLIKYISEDK